MEHNEIIELDNPELQNALRIVQFTHQSLFLTGKAGTGKSTFLRYISSHTKKKHVILAPTGIAAINVGGATLHSFFKLPFHPLLPTDQKYSIKYLRKTLKYNSEKVKLIRELELIIIDEISMVRADIIDFIDKVLRVYCNNMREPFGGKQLLFVGDLYQLEPVLKEEDRQLVQPFYPSIYFFSAHIFRTFQLVSIELRKVYRQTDTSFIRILDNIRVSQVSASEISLLNKRVGKVSDNSQDKLSITLSARRDTVDFINEERLNKLSGQKRLFKGFISGEFPENSLPTPMELSLKVGAQVLFIKNDKEKRWVNGTLGTIISFGNEENDSIQVKTEDGREVDVDIEIWSNIKYSFNDKEQKVEEEEIGTYHQYPIKLAWAITIHKSQGLTFQNVQIDLTGGVFAGGQTYVALSRCQSLEGITLKSPIKREDIFVRSDVLKFAQQYNDKQVIEQALQQGKADQEYFSAIKAFDNGNMPEAIHHFFVAIHNRYDIEKPIAKRFIQRKLNKINTLKAENETLKKELKKQRLFLKKLAVEYLMMGRECEKEGFRDAAKKNYEKALELYPDYPEVIRRLKKL